MTGQKEIERARRKIIDTIPKIIYHNYDRWADDMILRIKKPYGWRKYTWRKFYEVIKHFSLGLISLGLERGDVVCIIGENEPEWFWSEFAVQAAGGIATSILTSASPSAVKYITNHSGVKFTIVNDRKQSDKLLGIKHDLPALKRVIYRDAEGLKNNDDPLLISFNGVVKLGKEYETAHPDLFEQNVFEGNGNDIAFIYYDTSRTAEFPRGISMSHRTLINTAKGFMKRNPIKAEDKLFANFPATRAVSSYFVTIPHLLTGAVLYFPEKPETLARDTRRIKPDFIIYEPQQWSSIINDILTRIIGTNPVKRFFYNLFFPVGHKMSDYKFKGKKPDILLRLEYIPAYFLLFRPIKSRLGLVNVRFAFTAGPHLSQDTLRLIHDIGIDLRRAYVSAEVGLIAAHGEGEVDLESVGRPAVNMEVRITNNGELLIRSDAMFSGYYNDAPKTAEVLLDGWFHTGDTANINDKGCLIITGRI
jgi:long-chain acyl-CoA synthetase